MENLNNILAVLDEANKKLEKVIYVPSLGDSVAIRPLNAEHTKNLLKTTVEGPFADIQFNMMMYSILKDVLDIDLSTVSIYDKPIILIQLRIQNISPDISVEFSEIGVRKTINLDKHLKKFKKPIDETIVKIEKDGYIGYLDFCSIENEFQFDNHIYQSHMSKIDPKDTSKLKALVAPMFMNSVVMFLSKIVIGEVDINFKDRPIPERLCIADKLPSSFLTEAIAKIDEHFGKKIQKIRTVTCTHEGITHESDINIDVGFFLQ